MSQLMSERLDLTWRAGARTEFAETDLRYIDTFEMSARARQARDAFVGRALVRLFSLSWLPQAGRLIEGNLPARWRHRARVNRTVRELSRLDDDMLADVGVARGEIRAVGEALAKGPIVEPPAEGAVARWVRTVRCRLAQRRLARELSSLDDRILLDIGIERHQIPAAAWDAVTGNEARVAAAGGDLAVAPHRRRTATTPRPANLDRHQDRVRSVA